MEVHLVAMKNRPGPEEPLHWLLYIGETVTGKGQIANAVGSSRFYKYETRKVKDISQDEDYATSVKICDISTKGHQSLMTILSDVQIRNFEPDYNCQSWLRLALKDMVAYEYVDTDNVGKILETFPKKVKDLQSPGTGQPERAQSEFAS